LIELIGFIEFVGLIGLITWIELITHSRDARKLECREAGRQGGWKADTQKRWAVS